MLEKIFECEADKELTEKALTHPSYTKEHNFLMFSQGEDEFTNLITGLILRSDNYNISDMVSLVVRYSQESEINMSKREDEIAAKAVRASTLKSLKMKKE